MPSSRALKVFICHASQDKPAVRNLYTRLKNEKWLDPWLDEEKILGGQDWDAEIRKAIKTSDIIIVCLSKTSTNKDGYIQKEIRLVLDIADEKVDGSIFIIPLKLQKCSVPERLSKWQWIDYYDDEESSLNWLLFTLSVRAKELGSSRKIRPANYKTKFLLKEKESPLRTLLINFRDRITYVDNTLANMILNILKPLIPYNENHIPSDRLLGGIMELIFLLIFIYATIIQVLENFSLIIPTIEIPAVFQNFSVPVIVGTAGGTLVLAILLGELTRITSFTAWTYVNDALRKISIRLVASTLIITIVFSILISLPRFALVSNIDTSISSTYEFLGLLGQNLLIIPLLITTALLFRGVIGILVIFAFVVYIIRVPFILLKSIL